MARCNLNPRRRDSFRRSALCNFNRLNDIADDYEIARRSGYRYNARMVRDARMDAEMLFTTARRLGYAGWQDEFRKLRNRLR